MTLRAYIKNICLNLNLYGANDNREAYQVTFYLLIFISIFSVLISEQTCKGSVWQHCRVCRWAGLQEGRYRHCDGSKCGWHQRMVDVLFVWAARPGPCKQTAALTTNCNHCWLLKPCHRKTQITWCENWWQCAEYLPDPKCTPTLQQSCLWTYGRDLQGPIYSLISFKKYNPLST